LNSGTIAPLGDITFVPACTRTLMVSKGCSTNLQTMPETYTQRDERMMMAANLQKMKMHLQKYKR
jgi:hypothetical protein